MLKRISNVFVSLILLSGAVVSATAQTFTAEPSRSIYADHKARGVGDVITVLIIEFSEANNKSATSTNKKDDVSVSASEGTGVLSVIPSAGFGASTNNSFVGAGETSRRGSLQGKMTATIKEILPNGYFQVEGMREVAVNQDKQVMELSGIVRPRDIRADNTVFSYNIADAKIMYKGKGAIHSGQQIGILKRILNKIF